MKTFKALLWIIALVSFGCSGNNENAHTTATTFVSPPPRQALKIETVPSKKSPAKPDDRTAQALYEDANGYLGRRYQEFNKQKVPYDPVRDFSPIAIAASAPGILVVHPSVAAKSVQELIALAKAKPGALNYASGNSGSISHLSAELFNAMAGVNIVRYKLWAFALASFTTGVAGGLLAAQLGNPTAFGFPTQDSLTLLAAALIGGIYSLWGAVVAGLFSQLAPFLFQAQWGIDPNFLLIIFGVGLLQVLLTAPRGIVVQMPQDIRNLGRLGVRLYHKVSGPRGET